MSEEIKLSRDEQETHISQTAEERINGIINVYTDDPVWITKLNKLATEGCLEDVSDQLGIKPPGKAFRSLNAECVVSIRRKRAMSDESRAVAAANFKKWREDNETTERQA